MRTVILTAAFLVFRFVATAQTFESPNILSKGERYEFMEWYKLSDGKMMMTGSVNDIERYTLDLLDYYGLNDRDKDEKGVREWRAITKQMIALDMVVIVGEQNAVILIKEN